MTEKKRDSISRHIIYIIILLLIISIEAGFSLGLPPLPTEFYGEIRTNNYNASAGGTIDAYDNDGVMCGSFVIVNTGFYGSLTCKGDDPETAADEGAVLSENIVFKYNGEFTTIQGDPAWSSGSFKYINLTHPVVFCGDNFCDQKYENSVNCPVDCPVYNGTINTTTNVTINTTNASSGTGGEGAGGGEGETPEQNTPAITQIDYTEFLTNLSGQEGDTGFECKEKWVCGNWSECRSDGYQSRNCTDINNCGTFDEKPIEVQKCIYTPTCSDGIRNGFEEGIDCGGLCPPCIGCFDGIQNCHNGKCEEGIDCGGPCAPCASCFDKIKNCHDGKCEEGIDCGGPCEQKCPEVQLPGTLFVCQKDINPLSNNSLLFFIIIILILLFEVINSRIKIKRIKSNKDLKDIARIKSILSVRRKMYLFITITITVSVLVYLYYYFFIMCETDYKFLWLLFCLLFITPLAIHKIIKYLEYSDAKKIKKFDELLETHYKQIDNLIKIENDNLSEIENDIADDLRMLINKKRSGAEKSEDFSLMEDIYKKLVFLYSKYKERQNPIDAEIILCNEIYSFVEDKKYSDIIREDENITRVVDKLKLLYKQYEEKQKLYDELDKIDSSRSELKKDIESNNEKENPGSKENKKNN